MTLADLAPGRTGRIVKIGAAGPFKRRLMDMGIVPGADVRMEKVAPLGDPLEVWIKNYHLSLRKGEADKIDVEEIR